MAAILSERFVNAGGIAWVRTHATNSELSALCSNALYPGVVGIEEGLGQVTCPDCIDIVRRCQAIAPSDLAPEYENEFFAKRFDK